MKMLVREKMTCLFVTLSVAGIANIAAHQSFETLKVKKVYDYDLVLRYSNLFYQAMRSGPLDKLGDFDHYMIPYRGDSCLEDGADNGVDLTGGYFDDMGYNGYVKNTLMTATSTTLLAWGAIDFKEGYEAAGQMEATLNTIRWATDYLIKCYPEENILYIQVGDSFEERKNWMRIEDMTLPRLSYKINATDDDPYFHPGADLAGEMSAALAAASIVFKTADPAYSAVLLDYAKQLYKFAVRNFGSYVDYDVDYGTYIAYRCDEHGRCESWDEILWSAAWLYKATEDPMYMEKVEEYVDEWYWYAIDWEDKATGSWILLAQITKDERFINKAQGFCSYGIYSDFIGGGVTKGGLLRKPEWKNNVLGTLRHAANIAFVCLEVSMIDSPAIDKVKYRELAISQIHYALGDNPWGRSYVVGFGTNPPVYIHDRPTSCPVDANETCDWNAFNSTNPNPSTMFGALVGGPGDWLPDDWNGDDFYESRTPFYTRVAVTNNAGFQSAVAGLKTLLVQGKLQH